MNQRLSKSMFLAGVTALSLGTAMANEPVAKQKDKPNILFYLVDDFGWMDVSYQGSKFYETPNIDQLSREGVRFTNAYASHPRCVPSRYSIITGRYPARAQMPGPGEGKLRAGDDSNLSPNEFTVANALRSEGYSTFFIGKWHLASSGTLPQHVGFEVNIAGGEAGSPISYFYPYNEKQGNGEDPKKEGIHGLEKGNEGEYLTDRLTDETLNYLDQQHKQTPDKPFFAFVSHYAVHEPLQAKTGHIKKFRDKLKNMQYEGPEFIPEGTGTTKMRQDDPVYAAMIYSMDESLGRIIQKLKDMGEYENTIIIFFSDNGGLSNNGNKPRRAATSNFPLRAGKGHLYEGGIREPMIVKWPGVTKAGTETDQPVIGCDFYPTLLEMIGGKLYPESHLDGKSFVWVLKNEANPVADRSLFWHSPVGRPYATGDTNSSAIRHGDYKLIEWYETGKVELYNIREDLSETHDLSSKKPEMVKLLLEELHQWRNEVKAYTGKEISEKNAKRKGPDHKGEKKTGETKQKSK